MGQCSESYNKAINSMKFLTIEDFYDLNIFNDGYKSYEIKDMRYEQVEYYGKQDVYNFSDTWKKTMNPIVTKDDGKIFIQVFLDLNNKETVKKWLKHKFDMYIDFNLDFNGNKFSFTDELLEWIDNQNYSVLIIHNPTITSSKISVSSHIEFKCKKRHEKFINTNEDILAINHIGEKNENISEEGFIIPSAPKI
jgi:hypothetical protein